MLSKKLNRINYFVETSAMNGTNIENIFSTVLSMILRQRLNKNKETAIDEGKN